MIVIYRAITNTVYATCKEKSLLDNPSYIFKFTEDGGGNERYCVCTDSSSYPDRHQTFSIIETTTPTDVTNEVNLKTSKSWKYIIYEITPRDLTGVTDLSTIDYSILTEVEKGRVKVLDSSFTTPQVYTGYSTTKKTYAG